LGKIGLGTIQEFFLGTNGLFTRSRGKGVKNWPERFNPGRVFQGNRKKLVDCNFFGNAKFLGWVSQFPGIRGATELGIIGA